MKLRRVLALTALLAALLSRPAGAGEIKVMYPSEGDILPSVKNTFIFGNIAPPNAPLFINGAKINVYRNGAFIAYLPVTEGDFAFNCEIPNGGAAYRRTVRIKPGAQPRVSTGTLRLELLSPTGDLDLVPGDLINVLAAGTPGKSAVFTIKGLAKDEELAELPPGSGRYFGVYRVKDTDRTGGAELVVRFKTGLFATSAYASLKGRVRVLPGPVVVETSTDAVILRNGPETGYLMFLPKGVRLLSDGRAGGMRRIRLSPSEAGWVDERKVAPASDTAFAPQNETGALKFKRTDTGSAASLFMPFPAAYTAEERENSLRLNLYYVKQRTNTIVYDSSDTFVRQARVFQTGENTAAVDIEFAPGSELGGYEVAFGTKSLNVELRRMPSVTGAWPHPLAGLRVVVDPGHSPKQTPPYDGAIGPMGTFEYQVNLQTAFKLRDELASLGATVYLTRTGDETVQLADRPKLAREFRGDIYISLHNNAIADGEDPFSQPRGFSIYHYHRHSYALGKAVHDAYAKNVPLPDEGFRFGDYAVARMTYMPAILIESAYMILPEHEELLNSAAFRAKLAEAVTSGLLEFFKVRPHAAKKGKK